jgi:hypothetical protein
VAFAPFYFGKDGFELVDGYHWFVGVAGVLDGDVYVAAFLGCACPVVTFVWLGQEAPVIYYAVGAFADAHHDILVVLVGIFPFVDAPVSAETFGPFLSRFSEIINLAAADAGIPAHYVCAHIVLVFSWTSWNLTIKNARSRRKTASGIFCMRGEVCYLGCSSLVCPLPKTLL